MMQEFVYFISDGEYVKIGKSTKPNTRLSNLQVGNPRKLSILYCLEVDDSTEKELCQDPEKFFQEMFVDFKVSGEWYRLDDVLKFILKAFCVSMIDENAHLYFKYGPNDAKKYFDLYPKGVE